MNDPFTSIILCVEPWMTRVITFLTYPSVKRLNVQHVYEMSTVIILRVNNMWMTHGNTCSTRQYTVKPSFRCPIPSLLYEQSTNMTCKYLILIVVGRSTVSLQRGT